MPNRLIDSQISQNVSTAGAVSIPASATPALFGTLGLNTAAAGAESFRSLHGNRYAERCRCRPCSCNHHNLPGRWRGIHSRLFRYRVDAGRNVASDDRRHYRNGHRFVDDEPWIRRLPGLRQHSWRTGGHSDPGRARKLRSRGLLRLIQRRLNELGSPELMFR